MLKKILSILLVITLFTGVCGCMGEKSSGSANIEAVILYLNEKYDGQFSIISAVEEFDGYSGKSERYLCNSLQYPDTFSTIIYYDSTYGEDIINIGDNEFGIEDDFAEVVFENEILNSINLSNNATVKCNIDFHLKHPSKAEFESGLENCLNNEELLAYVKFYILSDEITSTTEDYSAVENWISQNKPYTAYIYTAVGLELSGNEIDSLYLENKYNFGNFLTESETFKYVDFTLYEIEEGFSNKKIVKE